MKAEIIGLWLSSRLEKDGITTIISFQVLPDKDSLREFDLTYYGLKILSFFGLVHDLRPVPVWVKEKAIQPKINSAL